jgi:hypothetical protein
MSVARPLERPTEPRLAGSSTCSPAAYAGQQGRTAGTRRFFWSWFKAMNGFRFPVFFSQAAGNAGRTR